MTPALFAVADRSGGTLLDYVYMDLFTRDGKYSHGRECMLTRPRDLPSGLEVSSRAKATALAYDYDLLAGNRSGGRESGLRPARGERRGPA